MRTRGKTKIAWFAVLAVSFLAAAAAAQESSPVLRTSAVYTLPESALEAKISGTVSVAMKVDEAGKPSDVAVIAGPTWPCGTDPVSELREVYSTLVSTVRKLEFSPAMKDGKAVASKIALRFDLKNPKASRQVEIDPNTGKPKVQQISGGVLNGKAVHLPRPAYPLEARANRDSGAVTIQILVDEKGNVIRAGAVSGAPTLQFAARASACEARFPPTTLSGNPVKVSGVITYNFVP